MTWQTIAKPDGWAARTRMPDYQTACARFTWAGARAELAGLPGGAGLNICYEAVDRHVADGRGARIALRFLGRDGTVHDLTYAALDDLVRRFAGVLADLDVRPGERVFGLLGRRPELYAALLGTVRHRAVFSPLFSAFGPEPVRQRLALGDGRVLVTTAALYRRAVAPVRGRLPGLRHILIAGPGAEAITDPGVHDLDAALRAAAPAGPVPATDPAQMALVHFTSGTTGAPKGAVHVHEAVVAHHATAREVLDLNDDDVFWCTADPGWVTGTSYGVVGPLACGVTTVVDEAEFDPQRWYDILQDQRVSVLYTAPTALRMLMRAGLAYPAGHDLSALRHVVSVGEPLNPEVVLWGQDAFGQPVHDTWWQTETGAIMIANFASAEIRPGSMGRPVPGIEAALLRRDARGDPVLDAHGHPALVTAPDTEGELALRAGWPSMMRGYLGDEQRYRAAFLDGWYRSGDLARRDADGWYWFVGRGDDVIKSAGHLIGPFEVESALMEHPAVAEAGVIGVPDPVAGEVVKAFVALRPGFAATEALRLELVGFGRKRLGVAVAPREIAFRADLPKTRSGKIMRRLLRARELGLPEGDLSTLEGDLPALDGDLRTVEGSA